MPVERAWPMPSVNAGLECSAVWGRGTNAVETILKASAVWGSPRRGPAENPAAPPASERQRFTYVM